MSSRPERVWVGANMVWNFQFPGHKVQLGSHFTCTCYGSLECERLLWIADRILVNRPTNKAQLIDASSLQINCAVCLDTQPFANRGALWCFCRVCLQPFHKQCFQEYLKKGFNHTCPTCRSAIHNMTETFNVDSANESNSESLKSFLPTPEQAKELAFPEMAEWLDRGNAVEDFPVDFERDIPWPHELAENMKARRMADVDIDDDFWIKYAK